MSFGIYFLREPVVKIFLSEPAVKAVEVFPETATGKLRFLSNVNDSFVATARQWVNLLRLPGSLLANSAIVCRNKRGVKNLEHRVKFMSRCLTTPRLTQDWLALWRAPELAPLAQSHPRVLLKLQRRYLRDGLDARDRWDILQQHYDFALKHFSAAALKEIFTAPGALLAEMPVADAGRFSVRLFYHDLYEKEGELSLVFYDEQIRERAFVLTFCVTSSRPGCREIFIGGLQGFRVANKRESVVAVTRGMFGLRPKALLLFVLQQLAAQWNVQRIFAVSNQTRIQSQRHIAINADYDGFWIESGSRLDAENNFIVPATFVPRDLQTIRPNKRTLYRRRYEMLAALGETINKNLINLSGHRKVNKLWW
jgi:uncharacterized protein VirK/YbjX